MVLGIMILLPFCYSMGEAKVDTRDSINAEKLSPVSNADKSTGENTSMNGNTSTKEGVPISSTAASAASRNASGNAD